MLEHTISSIIVVKEGKNQTPIYYAIWVLKDAETQYQMIKKLALALVTFARRLRSYVQSHQIVVQTDHPIWIVLMKLELTGQMIAWSVELSEFKIKYEPWGPMKAQYLVDFVAQLATTTEAKSFWWKLYVDGSSNTKGNGTRMILESPYWVILEQSLWFEYETTNNQPEYLQNDVMDSRAG